MFRWRYPKKKKKFDPLESPFTNIANIFKEYLLKKMEKREERREEKENDLSADEYLAKFIISRLAHLPEEKRDEKRQKLIEILLTK